MDQTSPLWFRSISVSPSPNYQVVSIAISARPIRFNQFRLNHRTINNTIYCKVIVMSRLTVCWSLVSLGVLIQNLIMSSQLEFGFCATVINIAFTRKPDASRNIIVPHTHMFQNQFVVFVLDSLLIVVLHLLCVPRFMNILNKYHNYDCNGLIRLVSPDSWLYSSRFLIDIMLVSIWFCPPNTLSYQFVSTTNTRMKYDLKS